MGSSFNLPDYDYVVMDSDGIVGVKDGKKTPIDEEEWQRAHPKHRDTDCKECTFVPDPGTLLTFFMPRELRDSAGKKPVFVGKFTMTGWSGHSGFYLFKCQDCDEVCVDYPHGYSGNGCLYLRCDRCRLQIVLEPRKYGDIYQREQVVSPPTPWQELRSFWKSRKRIKGLREAAAEIEDKHGIRVLMNVENPQAVSKSRMNVWNVGLVLLVLWAIGIAFATFFKIPS